jgi:hypothetical protein
MVAVVTAITAARLPVRHDDQRVTAAYRAGLVAPLIIATIGAAVLLIHTVRTRPPRPDVDHPTHHQLNHQQQ